MLYSKKVSNGKVKIINERTGIITTFDDNGGRVEVKSDKLKHSLARLPFCHSLVQSQLDWSKVYGNEIDRRWECKDTQFINTQKEYNGY